MADDTECELPDFEVDLIGYGSRVKIDGLELRGVKDVKIHQASPDDGCALSVTVTFAANTVKGIKA